MCLFMKKGFGLWKVPLFFLRELLREKSLLHACSVTGVHLDSEHKTNVYHSCKGIILSCSGCHRFPNFFAGRHP